MQNAPWNGIALPVAVSFHFKYLHGPSLTSEP